jgi:hypothetical protein
MITATLSLWLRDREELLPTMYIVSFRWTLEWSSLDKIYCLASHNFYQLGDKSMTSFPFAIFGGVEA